ncbi:hypothetical protein ESZ53_12400 [Salinibacterium sp. UTAS2018]|uniref:hypothetical protein n=1 Tax=Salinibacterium sp. UTAS2018 TaxID=2508880 RepID=UPI00100952F4|nr:hypothetical protein [Salinibacterium sp. UTAS2018]QAV71170.1 hypothetical protein ESZ53_12400 [Salinibacterium sp. UTAS2018]
MPQLTSDQYSTLFVLSVTAATVAHVIGAGIVLVFGIALGVFGLGFLTIVLLNKRPLGPEE